VFFSIDPCGAESRYYISKEKVDSTPIGNVKRIGVRLVLLILHIYRELFF